MTATAEITKLRDELEARDAKRERLDAMRGEQLDHIVSILLAFRDGEHDPDEWARHLDGNPN